MSFLPRAAALLDQFKAAVSSFQGGPVPKPLSDLLVQLKLAIMEFPSLPPASAESPTELQEVLLAREAYEYATLLSSIANDSDGFERHIAQVKAFYADFKGRLPDSDKKPTVLGLNLLHLLVENRLAEFHSELEHLSDTEKSIPFIAFPVFLEEWLMEGSYNKILSHSSNPPTPFYQRYILKLVDTVRNELADCASSSYDCLSVDAAQKMMVFSSQAELLRYVAETHPEWLVDAGMIHFQPSHKARLEVPAMALVGNMLSYATELDRIV